MSKSKNLPKGKPTNLDDKTTSELSLPLTEINLQKSGLSEPKTSESKAIFTSLNNQPIGLKITVIIVIVVLLLIVGIIFQNNRTPSSNSNPEQSSSSSPQSSDFSSSPDNSSSTSDTQSSSSNSESSIEQSSSSSQIEAVVPPSPAAVAYTNPYYPDLKINYDSSWAFSTSTSETMYKNVLNRRLLFIKNGVTLEVNIYPVFPTGCGGPDLVDGKLKEIKINSKFSRYRSKNKQNSFYYLRPGGAYADCAFFGLGSINSNLVSKDFTAMMSTKYVYSFVNLEVTGTNAATIAEVDGIVLNSKLYSKPR